MTSDKKSAALLAGIFAAEGYKYIVVSPGSRNAPVINSFGHHPSLKPLQVVDERSAAFFALGIAQQTGQTVALSCTSGTAALNYAPAIAEAFYQRIPLLIITSDRPAEMIDQGDGQTIRQQGVYANYILNSYHVADPSTSDEINQTARLLQFAVRQTQFPQRGPVHINLPFDEPIYGEAEFPPHYSIGSETREQEQCKFEFTDALKETWNKSRKVLVLAGMMPPGHPWVEAAEKLSHNRDVAILTETTAHPGNSHALTAIDAMVDTITEAEAENFQPDLLITFGGHLISKMVKRFLRRYPPSFHWHIDPMTPAVNMTGSLTSSVKAHPEDVLYALSQERRPDDGTYRLLWEERSLRSLQRHNEFLKQAPWSDLKVFELLLQRIPAGYHLQLGNSTPVRYVQLFREGRQFNTWSNRGTSGIDGTVSTAAGAAFASGKPTMLITGDLAFLYDSNALMNHHLTGNLRMVVINNQGGGIFRFIPGPDETGLLEPFFEVRHPWQLKHLAANFNIPYYHAASEEELDSVFGTFAEPRPGNRPALLEISTPAEISGKTIRNYFSYLKERTA
ncbi:MAG: 2-succinyl-5-enolpyruvyl-6-hydroxy-3-cyclohexene-1-carboxylic-acid synthase [Bacteroidales bacterium]